MATNHIIQPVRRLKLSDSVAAELERAITRGDYAVGEKLPPERVLAEQLGVGRSSMREALRLVEASGLLRIEHGIGVFVVSNTKRTPAPDSDLLVLDGYTIPELFEVRLALESEAVALAARRVTPAEAAELEDILARMAEASVTDQDFVELDAELHRAIARASKNKLLLRLFESIEPLFVKYSHRVIQLTGRRTVAHEGHQAIVSAIADRRPRNARSAIVRHLRDVERDIVNHLEQSDDHPRSGAVT